ncbi:MAG: hypothetical protein E7271_09890 [Lachnospiraceae bacterium]|jgi:S-adenosylmethionine hydrolase|nr:hypothetical protein [Lachnospiraceae bacterium]
MVIMDNIRYEGDTIVMCCYPEGDVKKKRELVLDAKTYAIISPDNIDFYLIMARRRIIKVLNSGQTLPKKEMSIWY